MKYPNGKIVYIDVAEPEDVYRKMKMFFEEKGYVVKRKDMTEEGADYATEEGAIERKTTPDFYSSIYDVRGKNQPMKLNKLQATGKKCCYVMTGAYSKIRDWSEPKTRKSVYGKVASLEINSDLPVFHITGTQDVSDEEAFVEFADRWFFKAATPKSSKDSFLEFERASDAPDNVRMGAAVKLVGQPRAEAILEKFKSWKNFFALVEDGKLNKKAYNKKESEYKIKSTKAKVGWKTLEKLINAHNMEYGSFSGEMELTEDDLSKESSEVTKDPKFEGDEMLLDDEDFE